MRIMRKNAFKFPSYVMGVAFFMLSATVMRTNGEIQMFEIELKACSSRGGILILNTCVCNSGYTGSECEVSLYDIDNSDSPDGDLKFSEANDKQTNFETRFVDEWKTNVHRIKREEEEVDSVTSSGDDGSGKITTTPEFSGSEMLNTTTPTTNTTVVATTIDSSTTTDTMPTLTTLTPKPQSSTNTTVVASTKGPNITTYAMTTLTTVTPKPQLSCLNGQVPSSDGQQCIEAKAFTVQVSVNETFIEDYNNLSSAASQTFITQFVADVDEAMKNEPGYISTEVTNLSSGSVVVQSKMNFESSSNLTTIAVGSLARKQLANQARFSNIGAQDVDECSTTPNVCGENTLCTNTDGSFTCACAQGFVQPETSVSTPLLQCRSVCADIVCMNGGQCVADSNNVAFCSCVGENGGPRCETSVYPWRQATIAVGVVLVVVLFACIIILIAYLCWKRGRKSMTTDLPLVTAFRSTSEEDTPRGYSGPYRVEEEDNVNGGRPGTPGSQGAPADNGRLASTTSTFKPDDVTTEVEEDKL